MRRKPLQYSGVSVVLSSPSGGGKTSIAKELIKRNPEFIVSISTTTRAPREGEVEGKDYYFKTKQEFDFLLKQGKVFEHTKIYNNYYGTLKQHIEPHIKQNKTIIFDIDFVGGIALRRKIPRNSILIFIMPPNFETLEQRLKMRDDVKDENQLSMRIASAKNELKWVSRYDYLVINDEFDKAVQEIEQIIHTESLKCKKKGLLNSILTGSDS